MKVLMALLCVLCLAGCSTVKEWSDYVEQKVKEKVLITTEGTYTVRVLKWDGGHWVAVDYTIPEGYYILPPLPDILGIK